ncbi:MAG: YihY/virulence factor BrkB family protein [Planctomycetota bacterium]
MAEKRRNGLGKHVRRPTNMPRQVWWRVTKRVYWRWLSDQLPTLAAGLTFRAMLTFFPLLLAMVSIVGLVSDPAHIGEWMMPLLEPLPEQARDVILINVERVASQSTAQLSTSLVISLFLALWSISNGILTLMGLYGIIYRQKEQRTFYKARGVATLLGVVLVVAAVVAIIIMIALPHVLDMLHLGWLRLPVEFVRYLVVIALLFAIHATLGRYAADRRPPNWRWLEVGSVITVVLWLLASTLFNQYLQVAARFDQVYGALAGIVVLALWLQLSVSALVIGALYNAELEFQTEEDSTVGPDRPKGERDAYVADHSVHE